MLYEFKFPDVGEGIHEGEIVKWHVKPNDVITEDQLLAEVQTDKAIVEISSPVAGVVVNLSYGEGDKVNVGSVWVIIETNKSNEQAADKETPTEQRQPDPSPSPATTAQQQKVTESKHKYLPLAVPTVRRLARELNVDLTKVKGSGKGGRITEQDVRAFLHGEKNEETIENIQPDRLVTPSQIVETNPGVDERIPLRGIRKQIAQNMMKSISMSAQSTVMDEVNLTALVALKEKMAEKARDKGVKLTYLPFIIKATIHALQEFPYLNATLDMETQEIVLKKNYNIGIAVDTEAGLMVPVIKQANTKSLLRLAEEMSLLTEKARSNKLQLANMKEGTFTISNIGSTRAVQFGTPILNYPEVAILGINKIQKKPIVVEDQIVIAQVMGIGLTFDHQVIDGVMAANFLKKIIELLEQPDYLFLTL